MREHRVLSSTAILGYGFPEDSFKAGLKKNPHLIAADAGSTDPGPYYLGAGISFTDRNAVKRDLEIMISAGLALNVPVIIGSAGGCGGEPHLQWNLDIVRELASEKGWHFKLAAIHAELDKAFLQQKLMEQEITPLSPAPPLTAEELAQSERVVAQMGPEPFIAALNQGAQVIVAGRSYDPAVFSCLAIKEGFNKGLAVHMGKILECGAIAANPGSGSDCLLGTLKDDCFIVEPLSPIRICTTTSVAAHTLYEKSNPYILPGPGGVLDLSATEFTQETREAVRVSGSKFIPGQYAVKLEGVKRVGYRTVSIAGCRDPIMMAQIDNITAAVRERVKDNFSNYQYNYYLHFHIYGKNGVMGQLEPLRKTVSHELGIVIEAVAESQEIANTICSFARSTMLHYGYPGRIATAGNLAFPYSPSDLKAGAVYQFNVYHLLALADPLALFPIDLAEI